MMQACILIFISSFPFCDAIRVINDAAPQSRLILATHHKTGTVLAGHARNCFIQHTNFDSVQMWNHGFQESDQIPAENDHVIHFMRHPVPWVVSWYLYEVYNSEKWFAENHFSLRNNSELARYIEKHNVSINDGESTKEFVTRVPFNVGLAVAYQQLVLGELTKILEGKSKCDSNPLCRQTCLESFATSHDAYMAEWSRIHGFLGIDFNKDMEDCVAKHDATNSQIKHATAWRVSAEALEKFQRTVVDLDKELGNGAISKVAETIGCDEPESHVFRMDSHESAERSQRRKEIFDKMSQWD